MEKLKVTVITPSYNREDYLEKLYRSLVAQTSDHFCWLIVDDGSTDNTEQKVMQLKNEGLVDIRYMRQANAGKHVALNSGITDVDTDIVFVVDSDDLLTPDAIETIIRYWSVVNEYNLAGISFLRMNQNEKIIGDKYLKDFTIDTYTNVRYNMGIKGDKAEVWSTNILKKFPFPVFPNEKFLGEGCIWCRVSKQYQMLFVNIPIYITEYLIGGLTKSGRRLRIENPLGGMAHAWEALDSNIKITYRLKNAMLYICYGVFANKKIKDVISESGYPLLLTISLPFGLILHFIWKNRYKS